MLIYTEQHVVIDELKLEDFSILYMS